MNWLSLFRDYHGAAHAAGMPFYISIAQCFKNSIDSGKLADNVKLPTNRALADILKVDRSTVARAYLELSREGYIESHVGRGTFVCTFSSRLRQKDSEQAISEHKPVNWTEKFSTASNTQFEVLMRQPNTPVRKGDWISFAGGIPAEEFYPHQKFEEILGELTKARKAGELFAYSPAEGDSSLRMQVRIHLQKQGIVVQDDELLIVSGSQQGIDLVANTLVDATDAVVLEETSYFWAILNFKARQARCLPVPLDEEGLRLDVLENIFSRYKPKFLYVIPTFQNPTGITLSLSRRLLLIELAKRYQVPILEDNFVGDLVYDGEQPPTLRALPSGKDIVIHQGTFSKALCPALRLGWLVSCPEMMSRLRLAKRSSDLSTNSMAQVVLARYLQDDLYPKHLEHVRGVYRLRRDTMCDALSRYLYDKKNRDSHRITWTKPSGGLFLWLTLPAGYTARGLLPYAESQGVTFSPGDLFSVTNSHAECLRLCFIQTDVKTIEEGVRRLALAIRDYFREVQSTALSMNTCSRERENILI